MIKDRTLTVDEIIEIITHCPTDLECPNEENCPLIGECLYYYTGDDSELKD